MGLIGRVNIRRKEGRELRKVKLHELKTILSASPNVQEMMMALQTKMDTVVELAKEIDNKAERNGDIRKNVAGLSDARRAVFDALGEIYTKIGKLNGEVSIVDKLSLVVASDEAYDKGIISFSPYMLDGDKVVKVEKTDTKKYDYFPSAGAYC